MRFLFTPDFSVIAHPLAPLGHIAKFVSVFFGKALGDTTFRENRRRRTLLFVKSLSGSHWPFSFPTSLKSVPIFVGISFRPSRPASHQRSKQTPAASCPTPLRSLSTRITSRRIFLRTGG